MTPLKEEEHNKPVIAILGAGNFGTSLAIHLASIGNSIRIWSNEDSIVAGINDKKLNPKYLSSLILPDSISATNTISRELFAGASACLAVIPVQGLRSVLAAAADFIPDQCTLVCASKGMEVNSLAIPSTIVTETLGPNRGHNACYLSGPSFAAEVAAKQPTAVVVASRDKNSALKIQKLFHSPNFRVYSSDDPTGVEIAGALKNVAAIASGAVSGLGFANNSRAALITRALAEITRVGMAMGANPLTFNGLAGVGDLILTCTSEQSRNFTVGYKLGKGSKLQDILLELGSVAEGVETSRVIPRLAKNLNLELPIMTCVHDVLFRATPIRDALESLLSRDPKAELS